MCVVADGLCKLQRCKIFLEKEASGVQPMLGNRCVVGNTVAETLLTNWGLSGIAGKRKQHLGPLSTLSLGCGRGPARDRGREFRFH